MAEENQPDVPPVEEVPSPDSLPTGVEVSAPADWPPSLRTLADLVRLPNVFTAVAGVVMGALVVSVDRLDYGGWVLGLLAAATALFYSGGVALNDYFDATIDVTERPERPIPSGRITRTSAGGIGAVLLSGGLIAAATAAGLAASWRTIAVAVGLLACIVLYDRWAKRTPLGPVVMGACRGLNVLLGMSVAEGAWGLGHGAVVAAVAVYIAGVTWFARSEAGPSRRPVLSVATAVILGGVALLALLPVVGDGLFPRIETEAGQWWLMLVLLGLLIFFRCLHAIVRPDAVQVQATVGQCLLSLVILDAAVVFAARGMVAAIAILLLLMPAIASSLRVRMS
ncbi:MAG: UbiA family prenyltransferase [Planctomycetota bacterium]